MKDIMEKNKIIFEGPLTASPEAKAQNYRIRDLLKYCEEKGINPVDMTDEERKQFELKSF